MENKNYEKYFSIELEYSILGSFIQDPKQILIVKDKINTFDFYYKENQKIYQFILDSITYGKSVNALDIHSKLNISLDFLTKVLQSYEGCNDINKACKILKEKSIIRQLVNAAKNIKKMVESYNPIESSLENLLADCKKETNISLEERRDKTIKEIGMEVLEDLEIHHNKKDNTDLLKKEYYGIPFLDKYTRGSSGGELTILGARPSIGKTTLALQILFNKGINGGRCVFFSLEMTDTNLLKRILSHHSQINLWQMNENDWGKVGNFLNNIVESDIHIFDKYRNIESIILKIKEMHYQKSLDFVVIDYLQLLKTSEKVFSENHYISLLSRKLKELAIELNIPILCLSQLNRAVESRQDSKPGLFDLRASGSLEQDADNVFFLYETKEKSKVGLSIAKQREGQRHLETILNYNGSTYTFVGDDWV